MKVDEKMPTASSAAARALGSVFGMLVVGSLLSFVTLAQYAVARSGLLEGLPNLAAYLTVAVGNIFIFNSFVIALSSFSRCEREIYLKNAPKSVFFGEEIKRIVRSRTFAIEASLTAAVTALLALVGAFPCYGRIFYEDGRWDGGWFPAVILTPICVALLLLAKYEARRYWVALKHAAIG